jgi:membrane fusion protein, multidrug efflux system
MRTGPRDPLVEIALTDDPKVRTTGRVREVAPQADSATRTYQVKVGIIDPAEAMRLGATVVGSIKLSAPPGVEVPASALTESNGGPAVWWSIRRARPCPCAAWMCCATTRRAL